MNTQEVRQAYHQAEIARLSGNIAAARQSHRNVDLERALILQHEVALAKLERALKGLNS